MIEYGVLESPDILRIRWFALPGEAGKLLAPSPPHRFDKLRIEMADEIWKRRDFAVFLSHEQEWDKRGQQHGAGGQLEGFQRDQLTQALTQHTVPHLIVILRKDHELLRWNVARGITMPSLTILGIFAGIHEPLAKCLGQLFDLPKIPVITAPITGEQNTQGMVKVIIPLGIERKASQLARPDDAGIVERTLGDGAYPPIQALGVSVQRQAKLFEKRPRGVIQDGMDGVEPQGVDVELGNPVEGIIDEKTT